MDIDNYIRDPDALEYLKYQGYDMTYIPRSETWKLNNELYEVWFCDTREVITPDPVGYLMDIYAGRSG